MEENQNTELPVNGLVVLLKENNVSEETALAISPAFTELYDLANEWNSKANEYLKDETLDPEEKAKQAKKARLALVKVRTGIDKKRKELNDADDKRIKDRNNAAKVLTGLVTPTEALLEEVEKKQENEEKERKAALKVERLAKLEPYNVDCTYYDLENMPDPAFDQLLENSRLLHEKKLEDEKKLQEKGDKEERFTKRLGMMVSVGFKFDFKEGFTYEETEIKFESQFIDDINDNIFDELFLKLKQQHEDLKKIKADEKKAEDNRLLAEKQKAERETALILQQQKEKDVKHNETLSRQKKLSDIQVIEDYQKLSEMDEGSFNDYFTDKNSQYQAEQNRIFIEKKKKERDDALEKEHQEMIKARTEELTKLGYSFDDNEKVFKCDGFGFIYPVQNYDGVAWITLIAKIINQAKEKREADLAPDKTKLKVWLDSLKFGELDELSEEATRVSSDIYFRYEGFKKWAKEQINNLK